MNKTNKIPDFERMAKEALKHVPAEVSEKARAFFLSSFTREGFTDIAFIPWVKRRDGLAHKILSQSYALKNSIRVETATLKRIEISAGEGVPYAALHNEGGTVTVRITDKSRKFFWYKYKATSDSMWKALALTKKNSLTINIPKRQYIGESHELMKRVEHIMLRNIEKAAKNLKHK